MADHSSPTMTTIVMGSNSTSYTRKKQREEKEAQERSKVTEESVEKRAELAREGILVRDFALELEQRERAERNRRADAYQAILRARGDEADDVKIRELLRQDEEDDERDAKRWKGGSERGGDPMDLD